MFVNNNNNNHFLFFKMLKYNNFIKKTVYIIEIHHFLKKNSRPKSFKYGRVVVVSFILNTSSSFMVNLKFDKMNE